MQPSFTELIDTYPDAVSAARRGIKAYIKHLKSEMARCLAEEREVWQQGINKMPFKDQAFLIDYLDWHIENHTTEFERLIKKEEWKLHYLNNIGKEVVVSTDSITDWEIQKARDFPINALIEVKRGLAVCMFHDDHKPSLKVYSDHVFCFSCQRRADAIDIYMVLNSCDFKSAVKALAV